MEIELQYNRARYYDPTTGRWISQHPLGFDAGDGNLYRYVNNRPTLATDPSGLQGPDQALEKRLLKELPLLLKQWDGKINAYSDIINEMRMKKKTFEAMKMETTQLTYDFTRKVEERGQLISDYGSLQKIVRTRPPFLPSIEKLLTQWDSQIEKYDASLATMRKQKKAFEEMKKSTIDLTFDFVRIEAARSQLISDRIELKNKIK